MSNERLYLSSTDRMNINIKALELAISNKDKVHNDTITLAGMYRDFILNKLDDVKKKKV